MASNSENTTESVPTEQIDVPARKRSDFTEGSIIKAILRMGIPSMIGFGLGNIYDLVDMFWLARLGQTPVAAVTILAPLLWVMHSANHIVGAGSIPIISRRYGEKDYLKTELAIRETILLKWLAAIVIGIIGYFSVPWIMKLLGSPAETLPLSITYGRIIFLGLGFNFATYSVFTALRGISNPNQAMYLMISLNVLNMVLDPLFIFGWGIIPGLGVAGAALASVLSYLIAFFAGIYFLCSGRANIRLRLRNPEAINWSVIRSILRIGFPSAIGSVSFSMARLIIMPMITIFGTSIVAAYGVGTRISAFGIMLLIGIGLGLSALIGQLMGAGKYERARRTVNLALILSTGIMTVIGFSAFIGARFIMERFFTDPETISYGVILMRIFALGFPWLGLYLMIENVYAGVGENRPVMVMSMIHAWAMEVPIIYLSIKVFHFDQNAVWWTISICNAVSTIAFYLYFRRGKWLKVKV